MLFMEVKAKMQAVNAHDSFAKSEVNPASQSQARADKQKEADHAKEQQLILTAVAVTGSFIGICNK